MIAHHGPEPHQGEQLSTLQQPLLFRCDGRIDHSTASCGSAPGFKALPRTRSLGLLPMQRHVLADVRTQGQHARAPHAAPQGFPAEVSRAAAWMSRRLFLFRQPRAATHTRLYARQIALSQMCWTAVNRERPHVTTYVQDDRPGATPCSTFTTHQAAGASCLPHTPSRSLHPLRHVSSWRHTNAWTCTYVACACAHLPLDGRGLPPSHSVHASIQLTLPHSAPPPALPKHRR